MELKQLARYPYVQGASDFVKEYHVTPDDLFTSYFFNNARERGKQRIIDAINGVKVRDKPVESYKKEEALLEILSYPVARMLLSCIADDLLIRRYAIAEAKAMGERLEIEKDLESITELANEFDVSVIVDEEKLQMHFADFLRYTTSVRGKDWKLINQEVRKGYITLKRDKFARVLEQALQDRIESELPLPVSDEILALTKNDVEELMVPINQMREKLRDKGFGEISITLFPPCMKHLASMAEKGENMPHAGRFALVTFLNTLGMSIDQIIAVFKTSPDFDNSKTEYQVKHITGDGSGKTYSCPECATMRTNGICVDLDNHCQGVNHPLTYYRLKTRRRQWASKFVTENQNEKNKN